jgi:hypothetical protein
MLPVFTVAAFATPVNSLLPKIKSIKGINKLREKRLKMIERLINRVYRPM